MRNLIHRRPAWLPYAWRCVSPAINPRSYARLRDYKLVLEARGIDYRVLRLRDRSYFFVPPLQEISALRELAAYRSENLKPAPQKIGWPEYRDAWRVCFYLSPLLLFYPLTRGSAPLAPWLPAPDALRSLGALSYDAAVFHGEWRRAAAALTLHADLAHLTGNLFFGALFLILLARLRGPGLAFFLTVASGICANFIQIFFREPGYASVGFSTAVFAALGLTAGSMIKRSADFRKMFLAAAAALALLAMLGTEGERTDYGSHIAGLAVGMIVGFLWSDKKPAVPQIVYGLAGVAALVGPWLIALR